MLPLSTRMVGVRRLHIDYAMSTIVAIFTRYMFEPVVDQIMHQILHSKTAAHVALALR